MSQNYVSKKFVFLKKPEFQLFNFWPFWGACQAPRVHPMTWLQNIRIHQCSKTARVSFMKKVKIPKKIHNSAHPHLPAQFSPADGQNSKFRSQHFVGIVLPIPTRYNMTPLLQNPRRRQIWREPQFWGPGPDPEDPRVQLTSQKITCKELK